MTEENNKNELSVNAVIALNLAISFISVITHQFWIFYLLVFVNVIIGVFLTISGESGNKFYLSAFILLLVGVGYGLCFNWFSKI